MSNMTSFLICPVASLVAFLFFFDYALQRNLLVYHIYLLDFLIVILSHTTIAQIHL